MHKEPSVSICLRCPYLRCGEIHCLARSPDAGFAPQPIPTHEESFNAENSESQSILAVPRINPLCYIDKDRISAPQWMPERFPSTRKVGSSKSETVHREVVWMETVG